MPVRARRSRGWRGLAALGFVVVAVVVARAADEPPVPGETRDLTRPLVVGAAAEFFPYSFSDGPGPLQGFAVDVADAVARAQGLKLERRRFSNTELETALRQGAVDFIQFWSETPERRVWADFSVPIVIADMVIVRRRGDARIRGLADLDGRLVAVGQRGNLGDRYLAAHHPTARPYYAKSTEAYLRDLAEGKCDAAVFSGLTARAMIPRFGLNNLEFVDAALPPGYEVRYCFAVRKGDSLLLAKLNEGLKNIRSGANSPFELAHAKWIGADRPLLTPTQVVSLVAAALAVVCAAAGWGFLWQRTLRRRLARQAEELAEQRSLLAALHEQHPVATLVCEAPAGGTVRLVSLNPEARRLLGLGADVPADVELAMLPVAPDWQEFLAQVEARWAAVPHADQWETRLPAYQLILENSLVPLGAGAGGVPRFGVLVSDVTRRRMMDTEIAQSRRLRALGELVGGIAHEFNNLLTPIIATTNLLQAERKADAPLQSDLALVAEAATRASALTRRLLTFGRKSVERAEPVHLAEAVQTCFSLLRPTIDRRIEWHNDVPHDLGPVLFNATDLHQIIFNLVLNARDTLVEKLGRPTAGDWTPRITITASELLSGTRPPPAPRGGRRFAAWQCLVVEDNGLGIPPEHLERVFEPFFTTKDVGKGTGLGLATIWHLVNDAGGDITVDSRPGEGTRFFLHLPRWEIPASAAADDEAQVSAVRAALVPPQRVLLVEDDPLVARSAVAVLERLGHSVTHLLDGVEAWSHLSARVATYDLLLLDVNMPRMNGIDLVRRLRGAGLGGRIVITSGRLPDAETAMLRDLGVAEFLIKPFTPAQLAAVLDPAPESNAATAN